MTQQAEKVHWYGARLYNHATGLIEHPSWGENTRCGIPVYQTRRISKYMTSSGLRRIYAGDPIDIPTFLAMHDRCRRCGARLRRDTGLVSAGKD